MPDRQIINRLIENWRREKKGAATYRALAEREPSPERRAILRRIADAEDEHAKRWEERLRALGVNDFKYRPSVAERIRTWILVRSGVDAALRKIEQEEGDDLADYESQRTDTSLPADVQNTASDIRREEQAHAKVLGSMREPGLTPEGRLKNILGRERWHVSAGGWLGQAIYGANDGLGAVFGIVSGMAGYSGGGEVVLVAGLAGTLASALSMGSGAYLATKSEREMYEAELDRERHEIEQNPEEEREELMLIYQLKGFTEDEARMMAARLTDQPEQFLKTLAHEELGISESAFQSPWKAMGSATISTAIGGFIPIIPFFFTSGMTAVITSMIVSTVAHFAIGAAKTIITGRSWFVSGMEMTIVGVLEAVATYGLGLVLASWK